LSLMRAVRICFWKLMPTGGDPARRMSWGRARSKGRASRVWKICEWGRVARRSWADWGESLIRAGMKSEAGWNLAESIQARWRASFQSGSIFRERILSLGRLRRVDQSGRGMRARIWRSHHARSPVLMGGFSRRPSDFQVGSNSVGGVRVSFLPLRERKGLARSRERARKAEGSWRGVGGGTRWLLGGFRGEGR
jgi:hypothetical protein